MVKAVISLPFKMGTELAIVKLTDIVDRFEEKKHDNNSCVGSGIVIVMMVIMMRMMIN